MFNYFRKELDWGGRKLILETGKIALDIPSPHAGRVVAVMVKAGDEVAEGALILTLEQA